MLRRYLAVLVALGALVACSSPLEKRQEKREEAKDEACQKFQDLLGNYDNLTVEEIRERAAEIRELAQHSSAASLEDGAAIMWEAAIVNDEQMWAQGVDQFGEACRGFL